VILDNGGNNLGSHYSAADDTPELMKFLDSILKVGELKAKVDADKEGKDLKCRVDYAETLINIGKPEDALNFLESVYKADTENKSGLIAKVIYLLGKVHESKMHSDDAVKSFEKAAELDNDGKLGVKPQADFARAFIMLQQRKFKDAAAVLAKLIADFPACETAPMAMFYLGAAQYNAKDLQAALTTFSTFADKYPNHAFAEQAKQAVKLIESKLKQ
jgi:tetratricopeptide (TPR) repeat protein